VEEELKSEPEIEEIERHEKRVLHDLTSSAKVPEEEAKGLSRTMSSQNLPSNREEGDQEGFSPDQLRSENFFSKQFDEKAP